MPYRGTHSSVRFVSVHTGALAEIASTWLPPRDLRPNTPRRHPIPQSQYIVLTWYRYCLSGGHTGHL